MRVVKAMFRHPWTKEWTAAEFEVEKDIERFDAALIPIAIAACEGMGNGNWECSLAADVEWNAISDEMEEALHQLSRTDKAELNNNELEINIEILVKPTVEEQCFGPDAPKEKEKEKAIVASPSKPAEKPIVAEEVKPPPKKKARAAKHVCSQGDCGTCRIRATYAPRMHHVCVHMQHVCTMHVCTLAYVATYAPRVCPCAARV